MAKHLNAPVEKVASANKSDDGGFADIIDIINPLQHIPVISTLYRKLTGDEIGQVPRIAGDTLYGGVFGSFVSGLVSAVANVVVEALTGKDIGEHFMAAASPDEVSPAERQQAMQGNEYTNRKERADPVKTAVQVADSLPEPVQDFSHMQMAVEQYKWSMLDDEHRERPGYWA